MTRNGPSDVRSNVSPGTMRPVSYRAIDATASTCPAAPAGLSVTDPPARRRLPSRTGTELASQAIWGAFLVGRSHEAHREVLAWYGVSGPAPDRPELLQQTRHTDSWIRKLTERTARHVREHFHPLTDQ